MERPSLTRVQSPEKRVVASEKIPSFLAKIESKLTSEDLALGAMYKYLNTEKLPLPQLDMDSKASDVGCYSCAAKKPVFVMERFFHHCRLCGHLFCSRCAGLIFLPSHYVCHLPTKEQSSARVCYTCEVKYRFAANVQIGANYISPSPPSITGLVIVRPKWTSKCTFFLSLTFLQHHQLIAVSRLPELRKMPQTKQATTQLPSLWCSVL